MPVHICDRKGQRTKVVDETGDRPIVRFYPLCSVCATPQAIEHGDREISLASLRSDDFHIARKGFPECRADSPQEMTGSVDVDGIGRVVVTFEKLKHRHHKTTRWSWQIKKAELAD